MARRGFVVNPALQRARFLAPGDKLGKHDLIRQIAVGGMAELYLARTTGLEGFEKLVVIKRILPQYANNASFVNMFLNEARLAATLHHPNIAQVYDIGQEQGEYFFSMEYVHGEDLGRLLRNAHESGVPVSLDAALTLAAGLCAGLHHAHEKTSPEGRPLNVVHRDVSPSNVLVSYDGAVKLVDFGIARAATTPGSTAGGLKGKISYMSPEQCRGKAVLDRRSDVFSVGTILYELTTGRLPFTDETEYGVLNQIVNTDAIPPSQLVEGYPPELNAIVMKALARDPDQRYSTALELQGELEDFAHNNRLRVSPLVLARLMSTLFPARLEEWANARAQGAFFVEQHVVRTLIENSQVDTPILGGGPEPDSVSTVLPSVAGEVGPPPDDDQTAVTAPPIAPDEQPTDIHTIPRMPMPPPPPTPRAPTPHPISRASTPPPHRPTPTPGPQRPTPTPVRTQVGVAPDVHQPQPTPPPHRPTPMPRAQTPIPGLPGAVPIVGLQPSQPGTLISNAAPSIAPSDSNSFPIQPVAAIGDMTMRVRVPEKKKSGKTALVLALFGALAAAGVTYFVLSRDDDKLDRVAAKDESKASPEPTEAKPAPSEAKPEPSEAKAESGEAKAESGEAKPEPSEAKPEPSEAKPEPSEAKPEPSEAKPEPAVAKPAEAKAIVEPKAVKAEPPKPVAKPAEAKTVQTVVKAEPPKPVAKPPEKKKPPVVAIKKPVTKPAKPVTKPEPPKEQPWKGDSPFMPVRTEKR